MNKMLVSACLLGEAVRYDGQSKLQQHPVLASLQAQDRVVAFCPEVSGGLPVPRPAAEIRGGYGADVIAGRARVVTQDGSDVTDYFCAGAKLALAVCRQQHIQVAVLTESSPSCGSSRIYDGCFKRRAVAGEGVTTALLRANGIEVFSQNQLDLACARLQSLEARL